MPSRIPEVRLSLLPETEEAQRAVGFKFADPTAGRRSKIGGVPDWLQAAEHPTCTCGAPMTFYAQLDSIGDEYCIADCGLIYVFLCFDCFESKSIVQSG